MGKIRKTPLDKIPDKIQDIGKLGTDIFHAISGKVWRNKMDKDYSSNYSEEKFWEKIKEYALVIGKTLLEKALILYYAGTDDKTPKWAKGVIYSALGYLILPTDAILDLTPFAGYSDDLGSLALALAVVAVHITKIHRKKAKEKLKDWFDDI